MHGARRIIAEMGRSRFIADSVAVIGGGPAELMVAALTQGGLRIDFYDAMPKRNRPRLKAFWPDVLRAWVYGLNIEIFVSSSAAYFPQA